MTRRIARLVAVALLALMSWAWVGAWAYCPHEIAPVAAETGGHAHGDAHDDAGDEGEERLPFAPDCPAASTTSGCTMTAHAIARGEAPTLAIAAADTAWPSSVVPPAVSPVSIFRPPIG